MLVGLAGAFVLVAAVTTSISGAGRLAYSLGQRDMLPRAFARLNRRTLMAPAAIVSAAAVAAAFLVGASFADDPVDFLAGLFSFGVLLAFTAAQVAVVRLRFTEPELERPFRAPLEVRWRGTPVSLLAVVGAALTFTIWVLALITHEASRVAGPLWLLAGIVIFVLVRRSHREPVLGRVVPAVGDIDPFEGGAYRRILVPLKLGPIGDEVLATALRLAEEERAALCVFHGVTVPMELELDAELLEASELAFASLVDARELAQEHGVEIETTSMRTRALGEAIVQQARDWQADLIVLGSAPRWRRQSRFFSPTVDHVLRHAPCEVMVVGFPQGVLEEIRARGTPLRSAHEGRRDRLRPRRLLGGEVSRRPRLGRRCHRRERGGSRPPRRELERRVRRRPRDGHGGAARGRHRDGRRRRRGHERRQHEHRGRPRCSSGASTSPASSCASSTPRAPSSTGHSACAPSSPTSTAIAVLTDAVRSYEPDPESASRA